MRGSVVLIFACAATITQAQPKFEVATVKQNKSEDARAGANLTVTPGGRVSLKNINLRFIISFAYDVPFQSTRFTGGPDWIRSERYDIEAAAPEGAIPANSSTRERDAIVRRMLQGLLEERFKIVMRRETKDQPIYAVVVAKKGIKLEKSNIEEKDCDDAQPGKHRCHGFMGGQGRGLHSEASTIEDAANFVSNWSDRPVYDQTGIKTLFKFDTAGWVPMQPRPGTDGPASPEGLEDPLRPSLFGIFDQLGLKLEPRKGPVESFHVESIERPKE